MNKIELLVPNSKIQKHKHKQFENYTIFNYTHDTYDVSDLSIDNPRHCLVPNPIKKREHIKKLRMS